MLFGLDGVELSLIIVFSTLFLSILSGYPVAFGLSGAAVVSFAIIALLNEWGLLLVENEQGQFVPCLLYTSPSPRDATLSRMPSSA